MASSRCSSAAFTLLGAYDRSIASTGGASSSTAAVQEGTHGQLFGTLRGTARWAGHRLVRAGPAGTFTVPSVQL